MILLTGSTGFLGSRLAARLREEDSLRLFVRDPERAPLPADDRVEHVVGDILDREALRAAMEGCDRIVHAAALVREWAPDPTMFDRVNVDAVEHLVDDAETMGIDRVVVVSSLLALGPTDGGTADENHFVPFEGHENDYVRTKAAAAERLRSRLDQSGSLVLVYPGVIYGPGNLTPGNIMVRLILDHAAGKFPGLVGSGRQLWNYVHVDDVADGIARALDGPAARRWVLGGENISQQDFWEAVANLSGLPRVRLKLPRLLVRLIARSSFIRARLRNREPVLTPGGVMVFDHDWALDSARAIRELGYAPRPLRQGLDETIAWLKAEGQL